MTLTEAVRRLERRAGYLEHYVATHRDDRGVSYDTAEISAIRRIIQHVQATTEQRQFVASAAAQ